MGEREGWGATALSLRHSDIESRKHSQIISFLMQSEDKLIISSLFAYMQGAPYAMVHFLEVFTQPKPQQSLHITSTLAMQLTQCT